MVKVIASAGEFDVEEKHKNNLRWFMVVSILSRVKRAAMGLEYSKLVEVQVGFKKKIEQLYWFMKR